MTQTRLHRPTQLALSLIAAALALLLTASSALATFHTRTPLGSFGPEGPGSCPIAGSPELGAATGTGDLTVFATGTGDTISQTTTVANLTTTSGAFTVGKLVTGNGIPEGTTIVAVSAETLTLSKPINGEYIDTEIISSTPEITGVATGCGAFRVGQAPAAPGIPPKAVIVAVGPTTLTLSKPVTASGTAMQLSATSVFSSPDPFLGARPLAFHQANNKLYVAARTDDASMIHAFDASSRTPLGGVFPISIANGRSIGLAVDNTVGGSAGNVYDLENISPPGVGSKFILFGFSATGTPLGGNFPVEFEAGRSVQDIAVDSAGTIWITDSSDLKRIYKFNSAGSELAALSIFQGRPIKLAFDSNNDLYVFMGDRSIWKYTAASGYVTATKIIPAAASIASLTIDRSAHILYAAEAENSSIGAYDLEGALLYRFGTDLGRGVVVDESTDQAYASNGPAVRVFGTLADFADASATPQAASNVKATSAELHATVDDNSILRTEWRFQVSKDDGATWSDSCVTGGELTLGGQSGLAVSCTAFGLQSNTDYLFRAVVNKGWGSDEVASSPLGFHTELIPPAEAIPGPASNVTADSAELHATINDNGSRPTVWRFEVSKDNGLTWAKPAGNVSGSTAGGQSGVAVAGTAKELDPNTEYRFRIVTKKDTGAPDEASVELTFLTSSVPPVLSGIGAVHITDTSAYLAAEINPRNLQTSYAFQHGPTPTLGSPPPLTDIGSGLDNVVVSRQINGLTPDTTYYFKLVATNAAGTEESAILTLHTRAEPLLPPEGRAYEQVTPPSKNFANLKSVEPVVAWDGGGVSFETVTGFGDDPPGQIGFVSTQYASARGAQGWRTRWLGEPVCATNSDLSVGTVLTKAGGLSANLDRVVIGRLEGGSCPLPPLDPAAPLPGYNFYLGDYDADPIPYQLLTPQHGGNPEYQGGSEDFSHVIYRTSGQQSADAPPGDFEKLFDWHEGTVSLLSKDTTNTPLTTESFVPQNALGGVSADASRVFFENAAPGASRELYMRQNNVTTYDVSQSECTSSCGASAADMLKWATPAGNKALFTSAAKLTNEDTSSTGEDLYLYTHSANPAANKNLTLLSNDNEGADGTAADVRGVMGMSDDGNTVYFIANGQIVAGAPTAAGPKVYRWSSNGPTLEYLATLAATPTESLNWASSFTPDERPGVRAVTPDGDYLLIHSVVRLDPAADHDTEEDVYRWAAQGGWACLSCQLPAAPTAGASTFQNFGISLNCCALRSVMSDDGRRVFFTAKDALVPADINGKADVYEWHDGTLSLISTGLGPHDVELVGSSRSGDDVFFATHERLVGWDTDDNSDIYDARVGGGFPEPPPKGAICEAEACRGAPTSASPTSPAGTAAFQGPGNSPTGCAKGKVSRDGRCVSRKQQSKKRHHKRQHKRANRNRRTAR